MKTYTESVAWSVAVNAVRKEFVLLSGPFLEKVGILLTDMKRLKTGLYELTRSVEGEAVCANCYGGCCDTGKYHFTVVDLLVYLFDGKELFTPDFSGKRCPYLGKAGCFMEPEYRPFNCITFHCEQLELLLRHSDIQEFYKVERKLRIRYNAVEEIFGNKFVYGLLANYERNYLKAGTILFAGRLDPKFHGGCNVNYM
jgi:hypothetical protein